MRAPKVAWFYSAVDSSRRTYGHLHYDCTFGWMTRWRRLVNDCEQRIDCSQAMIQVAMGSLFLRHIAHQYAFSI